MIQVIHYQNETIEKPLEEDISNYYDEVRKILPALSETVQIYFSDYGIIPESGIGGYAYSKSIITISLDPDFKDKEKQLNEIRPTIFHESFHQFQNFTGEGQLYSAIENSIYEGMATVFEREYTGVFQPYGDYQQTSETKLEQWIDELKNINAEHFTDEKVYRDWKFYHQEYKERWISYKVGTWIADQVLAKYKLHIIDLSTKTAAEVFKLFIK